MFDLYRQASSHAGLERTVVTLADYASREESTEAVFLNDLAGFLHFTKMDKDSTATFVISAAIEDPIEPGSGTIVWQWQSTVGQDAGSPPAGLGNGCTRLGIQGDKIQLPVDDFLFERRSTVMAVEACLGWISPPTLTGKVFRSAPYYSAYILPHRGTITPMEPSGDTHQHEFTVERDANLPNAPGWPD